MSERGGPGEAGPRDIDPREAEQLDEAGPSKQCIAAVEAEALSAEALRRRRRAREHDDLRRRGQRDKHIQGAALWLPPA